MVETLHVDSVVKVYNDGNHNAFTDICRFQDAYYLTFRNCPDGHMLFTTSRILVLRSVDTETWDLVCEFNVPTRDVRDPHFLVFHDALFVYSSTWLAEAENAEKRDINDHQGYCVWSSDGTSWEGPTYCIGTQGHYIWRAAACGEYAYLCGRRKQLFRAAETREEERAILEGAMLRSPDGFHWETVGFFQENHGTETAFLFEEDGSVLAVGRGKNNTDRPAHIARSSPPYRVWMRKNLDRDIGGPMLEKWGSKYITGGRKTLEPGRSVTSIYWLENDRLVEICDLPSGGDNSYPGFAEISTDRGLLSYYSSHEGSGTALAPSAIYLADLRLRT